MKSALIVVATVGVIAGCATTIESTASRRLNDIVIDGEASDWAGKLTATNQSNVQCGIQYDDDFVYLCVLVPERGNQMQMLGGGFSVWIDPAGGKDKRFGIRCPIGQQENVRTMRSAGSPDEFRAFINQLQNELQITVNGGEAQQMRKLELKGIQFTLAPSEKGLVYELKVPFRATADHPLALGVDSFTALGIGIESYEVLSRSVGGGMSSRPTGSGRGGRGGGMASGGGSAPSFEGGGERPKLLDFWVRASKQ